MLQGLPEGEVRLRATKQHTVGLSDRKFSGALRSSYLRYVFRKQIHMNSNSLIRLTFASCAPYNICIVCSI